MRVMDELSESTHRRTPSFPHPGAQSPRVGSCVGKFYQLFDWSLTKRVSSTKRIIADRPNQDVFYARRDRSFTERAITPTSQLLLVDKEEEDAVSTLKKTPTLLHSTPSPLSVKSDDASKRVPGVVARLMGLESLPGRTSVSSPESGTSQVLHNDLTEPPPGEQLGPAPVLLQELLHQEFQQSKKSLKDKFPVFTKLGAVTPKKNPTSEEHVQRYGNSRAPRPVLRGEKKAVSFTPEEDKTITKLQPFLARLQTGAPLPQPSNSQSSTSPLLSPSMIRGKDTVRLLEAAVKALDPGMQPSPRSKYSLANRESHRETQSESSGVSSRSEKRALTGSRGGSSANSSSRSFRSPSTSRTWNVKDDRAVRSGHESMSSRSRSFRARYEPGRPAQASRTRFEMALVTSPRTLSPSQSYRSRASNTKRVEDSPRALLGTHEASIRGFKTDLSNRMDSPAEKKLAQDFHLQRVDFALYSEKPPLTPSPNYERSNAKKDTPEPCNVDQNADVLEADICQTSPSLSKTVPEKPSSGGFRSIRFRSRSGKQEKDVGGQGNRVFPSDKHPVEKPGELPPAKEAKVAGAGFSYSMLFSRKQGDKKEGNDEGEALVMKRTDSTLMRSLLKRTSKSSKRVNVEVEKTEPAEGLGNQDSALREPASSPSLEQLDMTKGAPGFVQTRYRSIDDIFPELPMEEKDARGASPDLGKTIREVEKKSVGFGSQGDADCQSIERMFGKRFSRKFYEENPAPETSPISSDEFLAESRGVPGTFPNSPSARYEGSCLSSQIQLNLHEMFEVVSGDRSHDSTGRRRSFRLSEPRERVLDDEEAGAESDTCSNSAVIAGCLEIQRVTAASEWSEDAMTPPALRKFEEKLVHSELNEDAMTPPALKKFEEKLAHSELSEDAMTPPALKEFEEKLAHSELNEDAMTPPALKKFEEKLAHSQLSEHALTPPALKKFEEKLARSELSEDAMTPPALQKFEEKLAHSQLSEHALTPPALKKFEEKLAQGFSDSDDAQVRCGDECGQPSPVSVLQSPFLEETPTTPDASLAELQQTDEHLNDIEDTEPSTLKDDQEQTQETNENTATPNILEVALPETIQTDMIEQAILHISRIRNIDVRAIGLEAPTIAPVEPQQEQDYIREVLDAANLLRERGARWRFADSPIHRSLFDRVESESGILRSERKLLFDSVNEVMVLEPWMRTSSFYVDLPMFPDLHSYSKFRSLISGEPLVTEVHRMICHWRDIAGNVLDDLIDYDMSVPEGRWLNFNHEVADVGLQIERALLKGMIKEVVDDLTSILATRALRTS